MNLIVTFAVPDQTFALEVARLLQKVSLCHTDKLSLQALADALNGVPIEGVETKRVKR